MNRRIFMKKLMSYLKNISIEERENIEKFYNEMFDEQKIGLDDEVPENFGNPREIAMEILAEDIEMEKNNGKRENKVGKFLKKLFFVGLGILSFPFLVPIFIVGILLFAFCIIIGLFFSIIKLPFLVIFHPILTLYFFVKIIFFIIFICFFVWIVKKLYRIFIKNIAQNSINYTKKYSKINYKFKDEDYEIYDEEDEDFSNLNIDKVFEDINIVDLDLSALSCKLYKSEDNSVRVSYKNSNKIRLYCEKIGNTLRIYNEKLNYEGVKKEIKFDDNFLKNQNLIIYVPDDISIIGKINASNAKFDKVNFKDFELRINAGNVNVNNMNIENFNVEVNAGNIKGNLCYENMFKISANAANAKLGVKKINGEIKYDYSVEMGHIDIFGESFSGFGKSGKNDNYSEINMKINCNLGKITIE